MAQGEHPTALDQRIDELEALLAAARREKTTAREGGSAENARSNFLPSGNAAIPILDEEVADPLTAIPGATTDPAPGAAPAPAADTAPAAGPAADTKLAPRQLVELGQRLQQRLDTELEELTDVIRNVIKRCILEELRKELPQVGQSAAKKPDAH